MKKHSKVSKRRKPVKCGISYAPLWKSLAKMGLCKADLVKKDICTNSMVYTYLSKDCFVDTYILYDLCHKLNLKPSQVFQFHFDRKNNAENK